MTVGVDFSGRTALVTGSGRGMGVGIARALARGGARVLINDLDPGRAAATASELTAEGLAAAPLAFDVTSRDGYASATEGHAIDFLVNNAGIPASFVGGPKPFLEVETSQWRDQVELNVYGVMNGVYCVLPGMVERGFGRIVTISSDSGRAGVPGYSVYGAAKAGALQFTRCVASEYGRAGVTANVVSLGLMDNVPEPIMAALAPVIRQTPVSRPGTPRDVGSAVAFLCSDQAEWITGQTLSVNGGFATY